MKIFMLASAVSSYGKQTLINRFDKMFEIEDLDTIQFRLYYIAYIVWYHIIWKHIIWTPQHATFWNFVIL